MKGLSTASHVWDAFHLGKLDKVVLSPPHNPLPIDFQSAYLNFIKEDAKEIARDVDIPELVHATFYTMTVTYVKELGMLFEVVGDVLEETMKNL